MQQQLTFNRFGANTMDTDQLDTECMESIFLKQNNPYLADLEIV